MAGKNWFEEVPGPLVFNIVVRYWWKRKMLKKTETDETIGFCVTFLSLVKFQLGERPACLTYAPIAENKKGICKFSARFLAFSNKLSTVQKIVLSSSRGQGNFWGPNASRPRPRTWKCVFEDVVEAKDVLEPPLINKPHLSKTLVEWFQTATNMRWPLRHAHPETNLGWEYCAMPPDFEPRHKAKKCKIYVKIT